MRRLLLPFFVLCTISINAQNAPVSGDTLFNQVDRQGMKQGYWKVKYKNGVLRYSACFKNNKPIGLMKRYFDDGSPEAIMYFDKSGVTRAKLYFQDGPLAAIGNFRNMKKDSTWTYYSYYTKTLSNRESYINGEKNGMSVSYLSNGKVADESQWKMGVRNGIWKQYYGNDALKMSTEFKNGKRDGYFQTFYPDGHPEWNGLYHNDKRDGTWTHYDPNGNVISTVQYTDGIAKNQGELDAREQALLDSIEQQKGKYQEPDINNFLTRPSR